MHPAAVNSTPLVVPTTGYQGPKLQNVDRCIELWQGPLPTAGSLLSTNTCYGLNLRVLYPTRESVQVVCTETNKGGEDIWDGWGGGACISLVTSDDPHEAVACLTHNVVDHSGLVDKVCAVLQATR